MTHLSGNWFLEGRQIIHACAPSVRVRWSGGPECDCGVLAPRRVSRFYEWMTGALPATGRPDPSPPRGLTLIVYDERR